MFEFIQNHRVISLIGMGKNVGKTTVLNHLIQISVAHTTLAITSIGYDGEELDHIVATIKPRVVVPKGVFFATTLKALLLSNIEYVILKECQIDTAMGQIVIGRSLTDGTIHLTGPSTKMQMKEVLDELFDLGVKHILIDGAFGKRAQSDAMLSDATILATGAAYSPYLDTVVHDTMYLADMYHPSNLYIKKSNQKTISIASAIHSFDAGQLPDLTGVDLIEIGGALTDTSLTTIIKQKKTPSPLTILINHPSYNFVTEGVYQFARKKNIYIKIKHTTDLQAITINPVAPNGVTLDKDKLKQAFKQVTMIPIINVCDEETR